MARAYGWQELSGAERGLIDAIEEGRDFWPSSDAGAKPAKGRAVKTILAAGHIRAEIIRAILLGFAFERRQPRQASEWRPVAIPPSGLRIRPPSLSGGAPVDRVRILGDLNLHGLAGQGGVVMPPILLEYCDFDGKLDLRAISVGALSLQGSRFSALNGSDADIRGPLNLSWVEPYVAPQGAAGEGPYSNAELDELWPFAGNSFVRKADKLANIIGADFEPQAVETPDTSRDIPLCIASFVNASIDGTVDIRGARFVRMPGSVNPFDPEAQSLRQAFNMGGAIISGSFQAIRTLCIGGLALSSTKIADSLWFQDCRLLAIEGEDAVDMQLAEVGSIVAFASSDQTARDAHCLLHRRADWTTNIVVGRVKLLGLRTQNLWVDNIVHLSGGGIFGQEDSRPVEGVGLILTNADIGNSVWLGAYRGDNWDGNCCAITGQIDLSGSRIGSDLTVTHFGDTAVETPCVSQLLPMGSPFMRDSLGYASQYLPNFCNLNLQSLVVGNSISVKHSRLSGSDNHRVTQPANYARADLSWGCAVDLWKADVGRGLHIGDTVTLGGALLLERAHIGRMMHIECKSIQSLRMDQAIPVAIDATAAIVDGEGNIGHVSSLGGQTSMIIDGAVRMDGAVFHGDMLLGNIRTRFDPLTYARVMGNNMRTAADFPEIWSLAGMRIDGRLKVENCQWEQLPIAPSRAATPAPEKVSGNADAPALQLALGEPDHGAVTARHLFCFQDFAVVDVEFERHSPPGDGASSDPYRVARRFLLDERTGESWPLTGASDPIHAATLGSDRFSLDSPAAEQDYLIFFCDNLQGDEGSFQLVSEIDSKFWDPISPTDADSDAPGDVDMQSFDKMLRNMMPGSLDRTILPDGRAGYYTTVLYGQNIFNALFALSPNGIVEMLDDRPIGTLKEPPPSNVGADRRLAVPAGIKLFPYGLVQEKLPSLDAMAAEKPPLAASAQLTPAPAMDGEFTAPILPFAIGLERLHCGLIDDDFGRGWNLDRHILLRLAGINCAEVEPSGEAAKSMHSQGNSSSPGASGSFGAADPLGQVTRVAEGGRQYHSKSAARARSDWLKYQFLHDTVEVPMPCWIRLFAFWPWLQKKLMGYWQWAVPPRWLGGQFIDSEDFVPQTWDVFANAYMRAGEMAASRDLMAERKDIESLLLAKRARWWRIRPENWDNLGRGPRDSDAARQEAMWRGIAVTATVAMAVVALTIFFGSFLDPSGTALAANNILPLIYGAGIVATIIMVLPAIVVIGALLFRLGFKYGLSAPRAIVTFLICIGVGAAGTHWARTGSYPSLTTNWDALRADDGTPKPQIALVLATNYGADAPTPAPAGPGPIAGEVVYGRAAFCNLGVSSWQYAMDVFIPVLDLDQESRCSIREENEAVGSYNLWRWAKVLYEMLGWVVTSLTILTITGVMRRDMERN